ncbi:MAG TPA: hypothetical protein VMM36_08260 [Opitutaceae bacterium]|nr:hypothetical protein [Opitutaceae bacterium]
MAATGRVSRLKPGESFCIAPSLQKMRKLRVQLQPMVGKEALDPIERVGCGHRVSLLDCLGRGHKGLLYLWDVHRFFGLQKIEVGLLTTQCLETAAPLQS